MAIGAASYALTRTGARRLVAAVVAILALATPLALVVAYGRLLQLLLLIALVAVAAVATRHALGRDLKSLRSGPTPGTVVGPAIRPVLLMNSRSGGGKVERFRLVQEARRRGIEPVVLAPGDDLRRLAEQAVARGADVAGMAGGDGSQALVASVAAAPHDLGFVCVPAGTRNHLAMDLGLDRDDVVGALDAFGVAGERRIDLGWVADQVFVNNATVGLYAKIVRSRTVTTRLTPPWSCCQGCWARTPAPFDLRFTGPDGTEHQRAHLILVSNNRYELSHPEGFGSRRGLDAGTLGIVAARLQSPGEAARFARTQASGLTRRPSDWVEWTDTSFEVRSSQPVEVGVDGEAMLLDPPIRFRIVQGRCGYGSHPRRPATRPPPQCQPQAGPPSPDCGRPPTADP